MTKRTKIRIRKTVIYARGFFLALFAILVLLCAFSASMLTAIAFFVGAVLCFGISYFCDALLGGYKSPFYH